LSCTIRDQGPFKFKKGWKLKCSNGDDGSAANSLALSDFDDEMLGSTPKYMAANWGFSFLEANLRVLPVKPARGIYSACQFTNGDE